MKHLLPQPDAIAQIRGGHEVSGLIGSVQFYQRQNHVLVVADIAGLPANTKSGFFGLHIHEGNDCSGEDFSKTGSHYNPATVQHPSHAGDLPPLMLCNAGAHMTVCSDRFLVEDILGRTVVIHSDADDFRSQPAGNAGTKIACGVIRRPLIRTDIQHWE